MIGQRRPAIPRKITAADTLDMSGDERLELVGDIGDSIAAAPERLAVDEDERRELQRRLQPYHEDPTAGDPSKVVRGRSQQRRQGS